MEYLVAYFLNLVAFFSFCLFAGILIKRSAFALGFLIIWAIFETFLVYNNYLDIPHSITQFLPLESMSCLLIEPISKLSAIKAVNEQVKILDVKDYAVHWYTILIVISWTAIFVFLSYKLLKKRDL